MDPGKDLYLNDNDNENLYNLVVKSDLAKSMHGISFSSLSIPKWLLKGIYGYGFNSPSKIQEIMLPILLSNPPQNVIAQSQSGTGKTATFAILMLTRIDPHLKEPQCLVVAPTFELAKQIGEVVVNLAKYEKNITIGYALRGEEKPEAGVPLPHQIVIGTPGKLLEYCFKRNWIDLSKMKVFILDEADVMIDQQGHRDVSIRLKTRLPETCQVVLMSATFSQKIANYANIMVGNAKMFRLQRKQECLSNIGQYYFNCPTDDIKFATIKSIYSQITLGQAITFCKTKKTAFWLANKMTEMGIKSEVLSGDLDIKQRFNVIEDFRKGHIRSLITTNLTARGIDIEQITMVVNYDLPIHYDSGKADCETYLHRIGRTGRFGKMGIAINLVTGDEDKQILKQIEEHFKIQITQIDLDGDLTTIEPNSDNPDSFCNKITAEPEEINEDNVDITTPYWAQDVYVIDCD